MSSYTTRTSTHVNAALENYGAKTFGSLPRRLERLQRFNDIQNKQYAAEIRQENLEAEARSNASVIGNPPYNTRSRSRSRRASEPAVQRVVWPALTITREVPTHNYPLRSTTRAAQDLLHLSRAIENGRVTTRRG
jgi:hypothetical protein